jgi:hypothetical protein
MTAESGQILEAARQIGAAFDKLLTGASVNDSGEARISACLCLTIGEMYGATLIVFDSPFQSHAPLIIRSMHEALADPTNLVVNPVYLVMN